MGKDLFKHDGASDPPMKALTPLAACHDVHTCRTRHVGRKTHANTVSNDTGQEFATPYCDTATPNPHSSMPTPASATTASTLHSEMYGYAPKDRHWQCRCPAVQQQPGIVKSQIGDTTRKRPDASRTHTPPSRHALPDPPTPGPCRAAGLRTVLVPQLALPARATKSSDASQQPSRVQGASGDARWRRRRPHARAYCSGLLP